MALTQQQFQAWLESDNAIRTILVEVVVNINGIETTLYLSNQNYNTGPSDTPANTSYLPIVETSLNFTQSIPLDGTVSLSYGDITIDNTNGDRDSWLSYIWSNRPIDVYLGDISHTRDNFTKIYSGIVQDIASSSRNTLNISIRDILQKLNCPITSTLVGGTSNTKNQLRPLVFGEVYNITPVLIDEPNLKYMVHNGRIERIIEVRDNGVPIPYYTTDLENGTFTLTASPAGTITCSVQGERSSIDRSTGQVISHNYTSRDATWTRSGTLATITDNSHGFTNGQSVNVSVTSASTTIPLGVNTISLIDSNRYSFSCLSPENLVYQSENLTLSPWSGTSSATIAAETYDTSTFYTIAKTTTNTSESRGQTLGSYTSGTYTLRFAILAGSTTSGSIGLYGVSSLWGTNGNSTASIVGGPGTLSQYAGGLWSISNLSSTIPTIVAITRIYTVNETAQILIYPGTPTSTTVGHSIKVTQFQLNTGTTANTYFLNTSSLGTPSGTLTISSYENTVAGIIQVITQKYGVTPITVSNINTTIINSTNNAPVGIYITENTNIISVCQELADSIGCQFTSTKEGLVTLVKLDSPSASSTSLSDEYILNGSGSIREKVPVQGAIKLGYCKNWTIQNQLLTGIPEDHKSLMNMEYMYSYASDSTVVSTYNLSTEVPSKDTLLISNTPITYVTQEAQRLLNLWKTPRFIYKFEAPAKFLTLNLGDMVNITHYRFGLSGTKYGQVVSIELNWDTGRVVLGILV